MLHVSVCVLCVCNRKKELSKYIIYRGDTPPTNIVNSVTGYTFFFTGRSIVSARLLPIYDDDDYDDNLITGRFTRTQTQARTHTYTTGYTSGTLYLLLNMKTPFCLSMI